MTNKVRVRFAPSPTGPLHIGGVRTALFNYLFAKKNGGTFYLRIEDTDQNRFVPGAEEYIFNSLEWLGIAPDETVGKNELFGPYRQSERKHLYKQFADELVSNGFAYYAFDSPDNLENLRKEAEKEGKTFTYNWEVRSVLHNSFTLSKEEVKTKIANGDHYVIRFNMHDGTNDNALIQAQDLIRGEVNFNPALLDDKVLFKSDGMPTYHLANIVDDHLMETTHVIRGEEWLPSLPLHIKLYEAFGWKVPEFAHLPLILKPIGNGKLSKRDGDKLGFPVFPLQWNDKISNTSSKGYKDDGYFPEALVNFLALLGWNPGTEQELFTLEELTQAFDLNKVNKSGARFDPDKIKWFNQQYMQKRDNMVLAQEYQKIVKDKNIQIDTEKLARIISLIKERAVFVSDFWDLSSYFFQAPTTYDPKAVGKQWKENTAVLMTDLQTILNNCDSFESSTTESIVKNWIADNNYAFGQIMAPLRLALVGELKGPHIFDIMESIGKEETINRIQNAIKTI